MKNLDDLVFKNLHGLKDEEDQVKHKHDKPITNPAQSANLHDSHSTSSNPNDYAKMMELQQQQQQQMMYNYYMMQQRQGQGPQTTGAYMNQQANFNPMLMQNQMNMQNMQGTQFNMNAVGMQNQYSMGQQTVSNQFGQTNRPIQGQQLGQMPNIQQVPNSFQPANIPNFSQLPPMVQKQYMQMYQMKQGNFGNQMGQGQYPGQVGSQNQAYMMYQQNMGGVKSNQGQSQFNLNEDANSDFSHSTQPTSTDSITFTGVSDLRDLDRVHSTIKLLDKEMRYYYNCYQMAKTPGKDMIGTKEVSEFIKRSKIDPRFLQKIWELSVPKGKISVTFKEFTVLIRLIALYQQGFQISYAEIAARPKLKLPKFEDVQLPAEEHAFGNNDQDDFGEFEDFHTSKDSHVGGFQNAGGFSTSSALNFSQTHTTQTQQDDDFGDFGDFKASSTANPAINQPVGAPTVHSFPITSQANVGGLLTQPSASAFDDDFNDFQHVTTTEKAAIHQENKKSAAIPVEDDFDDFKDASAGVAPSQKTVYNSGNKWDLLDDFVEKKPEPQPAGASMSQAIQPPSSNLNLQSAKSTLDMHNHPQSQTGQMNRGIGDQYNIANVGNINMFGPHLAMSSEHKNIETQKEDDDFADFEEAAPDQIKGSAEKKPEKKEDLLFGALEYQAKKTLLHDVPEQGHTNMDHDYGGFGDFGDFEEVKPQGNIGETLHKTQTHHEQADEFEDFEEAKVTKETPEATEAIRGQTESSTNLPHENKKLTIYDIDLAEFGITENPIEASKTSGLEASSSHQEATKPTTAEEKEEFGDFVEINEEKEDEINPAQTKTPKEPQENVFGDFGKDLQFDFGGTKNEENEKKAGTSDWAFGNFGGNDFGQPTGNQPLNNDEDFDDFEQPQVAQPHEDKQHKESNDFADFQGFDSNTNQKEAKISHDNFDYIEGDHDKKETKSKAETNIWGDFGAPEKSEVNVGGFDFPETQAHKEEAFDEGFEDFQYNKKTNEKDEPGEHHVKDIKKEHKDDEEDFNDFEEYNVPKSEEKKKEKIDKEEKEDEFGGFEETEIKESGKDREINERIAKEQEKEEVRKAEEISKKLTIYDIDLAEFGITETTQQTQAQEKLTFNSSISPTLEKDIKKESSQKPQEKNLNDLYSMYGNTITSPEVKVHEKNEDLFGESYGSYTKDDKLEANLSGALTPVNMEIAQNVGHIEEEEEDEDGFDDFEVAPKKETTNIHLEQEKSINDTLNKHHDLFASSSVHRKPVNEDEEEGEEHDKEFGDFEDASPAHDQDTHEEIPGFKDVIEEYKPTNLHQENHDDDDFDNFEEAGHAPTKLEKDDIAVKSLSQFEGNTLRPETSDFGSLNEVSHIEGNIHQEPTGGKDMTLVKEESFEEHEDAHDEFGSFNDVDKKEKAQGVDHKDESIFHAADSSDYSPAKEKEKDTLTDENEEQNDDFGDFVGSKQDISKENGIAAPIQHENVVLSAEQEVYTLESVLVDYGIKIVEQEEEAFEEPEDLTEEIERRVEEIKTEYENNLFKSTFARSAMTEKKFKLNKKLIEEITKELVSIQKYKEAMICHNQIKVVEDYETLNETKKKLIEDEELEEAIKYKNLVKEKEKEFLPKDKIEEFLGYYDNLVKKDYRLILLDNLKEVSLQPQYINYFYIEFLGGKLKPKDEEFVVPKNEEQEASVNEEKAVDDDDDFEDFEKVEAAPQEENKAESDEATPQTIEQLLKTQERMTKWALVAKVMRTFGAEFHDNAKVLLCQIIYEAHRFIKFTANILKDNNKDAVRAVISSQKYENYIKGIKVFLSFYRDLKKGFEYLKVQRKYMDNYSKVIEELIERINEVKIKIKEECEKQYIIEDMQAKTEELEWLTKAQGLNDEILSHVCHISLKVSPERLTKYSGNYYFLPYLNFLLSIA